MMLIADVVSGGFVEAFVVFSPTVVVVVAVVVGGRGVSVALGVGVIEVALLLGAAVQFPDPLPVPLPVLLCPEPLAFQGRGLLEFGPIAGATVVPETVGIGVDSTEEVTAVGAWLVAGTVGAEEGAAVVGGSRVVGS